MGLVATPRVLSHAYVLLDLSEEIVKLTCVIQTLARIMAHVMELTTIIRVPAQQDTLDVTVKMTLMNVIVIFV